jgi:large subunit ribosomal protein L29
VSIEANDLRGNDPDELRRTVRKLEEDLFKHKLKKTTSQLENTMLIRHTRRDIARVNTVLAEKLRGVAIAQKPAPKAVAEAAPDAAAEPAKAKAGAPTKSAAKPAAKGKAPAKAKTTAKET